MASWLTSTEASANSRQHKTAVLHPSNIGCSGAIISAISGRARRERTQLAPWTLWRACDRGEGAVTVCCTFSKHSATLERARLPTFTGVHACLRHERRHQVSIPIASVFVALFTVAKSPGCTVHVPDAPPDSNAELVVERVRRRRSQVSHRPGWENT
jgi:hypothetical protein